MHRLSEVSVYHADLKPMPDDRLITETRKRIDKHDFESLFAGGGCFHFAQRLNERFGYRIRGIREGCNPTVPSHVWGITAAGKGVDIRGVYPEDLLARLANGGYSAQVTEIAVDDVRRIILEKGYALELEKELFTLADWIVDNHERFLTAKPVDQTLYSKFKEDIESERHDG